jgi:hypothetical protein
LAQPPAMLGQALARMVPHAAALLEVSRYK